MNTKLSVFKTVLLGIFSLAGLAGIFVFATYTGSKTDTTEVGPVVIWGTLPKVDIQTTLTTLAQTSPTFKSVSYLEKDPGVIPSELASAIATGSGPDLILDSQENLLALTKYLTTIPFSSLPESSFQNAFIGGAAVYRAPEGYYGVPFLVDPLSLFSNRAILSSSGVAQPPFTWEALAGLVGKIATLTPTRQVTRGLIGLGTYSNVQNARGILSALFLQLGVPVTYYGQNGVLTANLGSGTSQASSPGSAVVSFYSQFADPSKISYTWNASLPNSRQAFLVGDVALYLGYVSEARYLRAANPNLDFMVSALPQPATSATKATYGRVYAFMIPRGARNASGAYTVAVELTNSDAQKMAAGNTGLAPVKLTELSSPPSDAVLAVAYSQALYSKGWLSPGASATDQVFSAMIGNVISGRLTKDSAVSTAERALGALLVQ